MVEKPERFPIDFKIFPISRSFPVSVSRWVRIALFLELSLAFISVIGALILIVLPQPKIPPEPTQATTKPASTILPGCPQ